MVTIAVPFVVVSALLRIASATPHTLAFYHAYIHIHVTYKVGQKKLSDVVWLSFIV